LATVLQPSVHSVLKVTNHSLWHAVLHLWNKLPATLRVSYWAHCNVLILSCLLAYLLIHNHAAVLYRCGLSYLLFNYRRCHEAVSRFVSKCAKFFPLRYSWLSSNHCGVKLVQLSPRDNVSSAAVVIALGRSTVSLWCRRYSCLS